LTSEPATGQAGAAAASAGEGTYDLAAHRCFACGELNARGIRMALHMEPDRAWSDLTLDATFQGWEGVAHGGILATLLDEAMAWATASRETFGFTARMTIEYRRPVPVGVPIRVEGRIVEVKRRLTRTEASVIDPATGEVLAHAEGVYIAAPEERATEMRERYRFRGAVDAPDGTRRWRVVQTLPAVEPAGGATGDPRTAGGWTGSPGADAAAGAGAGAELDATPEMVDPQVAR
jgi:uncharacterized protein (TIGR00369 family)